MIPAWQQIYVSFNQLSYVGASLDFLYNDLKSLKHYQADENQNKLFLNNSITLKQIYYNYPNNLQSTLKNINMNIPVHTTVGIVGATGSGKTTTVDIILGLLEAHKGSLEVDGQVITKIILELGSALLDMFLNIFSYQMTLLQQILLLE